MDRNRHGGGIIVHVREDIPSRKLETCKADGIEVTFGEINLRKSKWLTVPNYRPATSSKLQYFNSLGITLDFYSKSYDNGFQHQSRRRRD